MQKSPRKIMIFGRSGGGKSTFALLLSKALKIPVHHLDKHFFEENWIERDYQVFLNIQQSIVNSESWIIDGNSTKSLEMRYSKADLVLYFNYPRWLCYLRIVKRLFNKDASIDDRAEGCNETIRLSLLRYMWSYEERVAPQIASFKKTYPNTRFIEIRNDAELKAVKKELMQTNMS